MVVYVCSPLYCWCPLRFRLYSPCSSFFFGGNEVVNVTVIWGLGSVFGGGIGSGNFYWIFDAIGTAWGLRVSILRCPRVRQSPKRIRMRSYFAVMRSHHASYNDQRCVFCVPYQEGDSLSNDCCNVSDMCGIDHMEGTSFHWCLSRSHPFTLATLVRKHVRFTSRRVWVQIPDPTQWSEPSPKGGYPA